MNEPRRAPLPCPACQLVADRLVALAASFGHGIANGQLTVPLRLVCAAHLPLVADFTAPRDLARWLSAVLAVGASVVESGTSSCEFCVAETAALDEVRAERWSYGVACGRHAGLAPEGIDAVVAELDRIASGEHLPQREEATALRTALVRYASVAGTKAFVRRMG